MLSSADLSGISELKSPAGGGGGGVKSDIFPHFRLDSSLAFNFSLFGKSVELALSNQECQGGSVLDDRKLSVLRAIVDEFVTSQEPVGSKSIAQRHVLGVSPATIRNDMAALEDGGYIHAPHTSAGRIPTDKGYRMFVDQLAAVKPLSAAERSAIDRFLADAVDLDDVMLRTTKLLAQLTRQVAVVQYPSLRLSVVRHVELVSVSVHRIMLVVIVDTGRVEQRIVEVAQELSATDLEDLKNRINAAIAGKIFNEVPDALEQISNQVPSHLVAINAVLVACLLESLVEKAEDRVVVTGAANLARHESVEQMAPILQALEENVVLLKLLGEAASDLQVTIGSENNLATLNTAAVVSAGYGSEDRSVARLAVVGPTHMNYTTSIASVTAVARYVGKIVTEANSGS
jgi:heat-inducible transcriptional repressor